MEERTLLSAPPLPVLPNETIDQSFSLGDLSGGGQAQSIGSINNAADVVWYTFTLDQGGEVTVQARAQAAGAPAPVLSLFNTDPFNDLYDTVGHRILAQSSGPGDAFLDRPLGQGTYYVAVSGAGNRHFDPNLADSGEGGATGDYSLVVNETDVGPPPFAPPAVLAADTTAGPTPDASTARSPFEIHLDLSGPLDPSLQWNLFDLNVTLTAADDPTTNLISYVSFSSDANELLITPVAPLAPGDYTISVAAMTFSGVQALDQDFSQTFSVTGIEGQAQADDTAATAHSLGDITSSGLVQVAGAIGDDPAYNPANPDPTLSNPAADVDLYHFTVSGDGNHALIAEAFAGRLGSPLLPALTLFRLDPTSGQLVFVAVNAGTTNATPDANGNMPLFNDPVLFQGLAAGDYYLAVSGAGNAPDPTQGLLPGTNGVFDPNVSHSGMNGYSTGDYVLNLVVHTQNTPPQVVSVTPADGDSLTAPPTYLTVQFSEPVNLQQLGYLSAQGQMNAVYILGADGTTYYPRLASYDTNTNTATFLMLNALPNGVNELHLSGPGGLTDLAGNALVGNDPSGDYVVSFAVNGPPRPTLNPGPGPDSGQYVWQRTPASADTQPQVLGTLYPVEMQKNVVQNGVTLMGTALERDFTSDPADSPSDTTDTYQFTVLQSRPYFFALSGSNLPAGTVPVIYDVTNGRTVFTVGLPGGIRFATLDPGVYQVSIGLTNHGSWLAAPADVTYKLVISLSGPAENPTPLTSGPAPAFLIHLPDPSPPPPATTPSSPPTTPSSPPTTSSSGNTPPLGPVAFQPTGTGTQTGQSAQAPGQTPAPTNQTPTQSPPAVAQTSAPADPASAPPLRLNLPGPIGEPGPAQTVAASLTTPAPSAGAPPLVALPLHITADSVRGPDVPTGALIAMGNGPLGGVGVTNQTSPTPNPLRLVLPQPDYLGPDGRAPNLLVSAPFTGGDVIVVEGATSPQQTTAPPAGTPGFGLFLPGFWWAWPLSGVVWSWITSPFVLGLTPLNAMPLESEQLDALDAALADPDEAVDTGAVDGAWAVALLAAGGLSVTQADRERTAWPGRGRPRGRQGGGQR